MSRRNKPYQPYRPKERVVHVYRGGRDTDVSLKEYLESRLNNMDVAVALARTQMESRLDGFPPQFMRVDEYNSRHNAIVDDVTRIKDVAVPRVEYEQFKQWTAEASSRCKERIDNVSTEFEKYKSNQEGIDKQRASSLTRLMFLAPLAGGIVGAVATALLFHIGK